MQNMQDETELPTDEVKNMRAQGMDNNQIIQTLQKEGYSSSDIFDAMNQADMPDYPDSQNQQPSASSGMTREQNIPNPPSQRNTSQATTQNTSGQYLDDPAVEEMIEAVIDEKWNEFLKDLTKLIEWKNATEERINNLEQQFEDLQREFDKVHSALINKVEDYDENIKDVGADVKAMEKAFSKILPEFTENVSELSEIAEEMKEAKSDD